MYDIGSPLEQFLLYPIFMGDNFTLNVYVLLSLFFVLLGKAVNIALQPAGIYEVLINLVKPQKFSCNYALCSLFGCWFFFILTALALFNVLSLFPYVTAITGYLATTLSLSLVYMSWVSTIFFFRYPTEFTILFLPAGAPLFITPLLVLIELFSYLMRPLSLALRLFANITAGHMLLGILSFFLFKGLSANPLIVVPLLIVHCIGILEVGVAFLQVYVWVTLSSLYLTDLILN